MRRSLLFVLGNARPRQPLTSKSALQPLRWLRKSINISVAPTTEAPRVGGDAFGSRPSPEISDLADARFEILGSPYPLLSVSLSASQKLFTRRGTLVAVTGEPDNAQSTLSLLNPLTRAPLGVPFLYQRISSSTPMTAIISTKSPTTTFGVLHLDGTTDWIVAQRNALLAWTGHTLSLSTRLQTALSLAHWGSTLVTGRGLAALAAPGQLYELSLAEGEDMVVHPTSVVAYGVTRAPPPQPYRLRSSVFRLQVPSSLAARISALVAEPDWLRRLRDSGPWKALVRGWAALRTAARRSIWGDRLFLRFRGPATIIMSSRGVRVADVLSREQVNEIAETVAGGGSSISSQAGAGALADHAKSSDATSGSRSTSDSKLPGSISTPSGRPPSALHVATVGRDGKVAFEDAKDLKEFLR